jgi:hypothetical protein
MHYGVSHEDWVWRVRCEPGVVDAFAKYVSPRTSFHNLKDRSTPYVSSRVYGTDDLIVSFDVVNVQWPNRKDAPKNSRWAHQVTISMLRSRLGGKN